MAPVIDALGRADCEVHELRLRLDADFAQAAEICRSHMRGEFDIVLLLGDRFQTLAAAGAATVAQIPIAHLHGGETTYGSFDNPIRDAVTKLSHVHLVAAPEHHDRLWIDLDEYSSRIHVVGAPGLDNIVDMPERQPTKTFVCTYHPCTATEESIEPLLEALDSFPDYEQLWTGVNHDPGNRAIVEALAGRHVGDLSPRGYLLACRQAAAVVGNSSSGIIEAPSLEVPSVDVGRRQEGRLRGPSVLNALMEAQNIKATIANALQYEGSFDNPYGPPGASARIADILASIDLDGIRVK
jgi:UDP-hydrolysing UDP-N-acetyl-D-glucosamine 2-epimerase